MGNPNRGALGGYFLLIALSVLAPTRADASGDPRFFGTYCGTHVETQEFPLCIPFTPICWRETRTSTFAITAQTEYRETPAGRGLIVGSGTAEGEGRSLPFVFSGVVTGLGRARGTGGAPSIDPTTGTATLTEAGEKLTVQGMSRTIVVRKNLCDNDVPAATIEAPTLGEFPWAEVIRFEGRASDREDASFPAERLLWTSSRDGRLGTGLGFHRNFLSPGRHTIEFIVTDSGSRRATASREVTIRNNVPRVRILSPEEGATFTANQEIPFSVWATDVEGGHLMGDALAWTDGDGRQIGVGESVRAQLPEGAHSVMVTADDGEDQARATVNVSIGPASANGTPVPSILSPVPFEAVSDWHRIPFIADPGDPENEDVMLVWRVQRGGAPDSEALEFVGNGDQGPIPSVGDGDTRYTVTVTATDPAGNTGQSAPITIYVIFGGLI